MRLLLLLICLVAATASVRAEDGSSVIVVYNKSVKASKEVAEHYAAKRGVPEKQVFGFALPEGESMSRKDFKQRLWNPLWRQLEKDNLFVVKTGSLPGTNGQPGKTIWRVAESPIRYLVLCYGVPLRVVNDPTLEESLQAQVIPQFKDNGAALESELCLLPLYNLNPQLTGPLNNVHYGQTNTAMLHPTNGILLVARLDGPTPDIAKGLVDKALLAEAKGLWGRAYIDSRNIRDGSYKLGDDWMRDAAVWTRGAGFETVLDEKPELFPTWYPMSHIAFYAGWYTTHVEGPFTRAKVEFVPGAFAYHLHSGSATTLRNPNQNWVAPLLAAGATCTMGSVDEPYLSGTPDVAMFARLFFLHGQSFGEAAYTCSLTVSWKTAVVGDPLYRPMARDFQKTHEALVAAKDPLADWSHLNVVNRNLALGSSPNDVVAYLEQIPNHNDSAVLMEKLGDLHRQLGKPASALDAWQKALAKAESLQQTIRLKLTVADALVAAGKPTEGLDVLDAFLKAYPDYTGRKGILEKAIPLAEKAGRKEAEASYRAELLKLSPPPEPKPAAKADEKDNKSGVKVRVVGSGR